jgi:DNA-binding LacI/PurR family transcriptional regulator
MYYNYGKRFILFGTLYMANKKITIYEVAEKAGVSISTVSKVLSNKNGVSASTRQRVWDAAHELGFVPSLAARSLSGGKTGIIGLLVPYSPEQLFTDPHLLGNIHGIEQVLNEHNYNLLLATAQKIHDPVSSYKRLFRANYFDGVIVMETQESQQYELHRRLAEEGIPWVILGYPAGITPCYSVYADDYQGGQIVAEYLLSLGHKRIGIVSADPRPSAFDERLRGFEQIIKNNGIELAELPIVWGDMTRQSGYQIAPKLMASQLTAVFALNDRMALGILDWAVDHGVDIPGDLSIVGFDDIPEAIIQKLTTIRQPAIEMGSEAVKLLFRLLAEENVPSRIVTPVILIERETAHKI